MPLQILARSRYLDVSGYRALGHLNSLLEHILKLGIRTTSSGSSIGSWQVGLAVGNPRLTYVDVKNYVD